MAVKQKLPQKRKPRAKAVGTKKKEAASGKPIKIKLVRSLIGRPGPQREVARGLGLKKMHSEVVRSDTPEIRGMIRKISHLLHVEAMEEQ